MSKKKTLQIGMEELLAERLEELKKIDEELDRILSRGLDTDGKLTAAINDYRRNDLANRIYLAAENYDAF